MKKAVHWNKIKFKLCTPVSIGIKLCGEIAPYSLRGKREYKGLKASNSTKEANKLSEYFLIQKYIFIY